MAEAPLPYYEPDELAVGESASWLLNEPYYLPADGWVVTYGFVSQTDKSVKVVGVDNGDGTHKITLDTATTAAFTAELHYYEAFAANSGTGENVRIRTGRINIAPDLTAQSTGYDNRSHNQKMLDAINALLEGRAGKDVDSYTINGRSLVKMKPPELMAWKRQYEAWVAIEVNQEKVKRGDRSGNKVRTRFPAMSKPAGFGTMRGR